MEFPDELRLFRERTADPSFEALIVLGTEAHNITAGLLLGTLSLRYVAFLTTPETRGFPQHIAGLLGRSAEGWLCPQDDHSSTRQVYRSVKALRAAWADIADPARIAVDVTGGRKPMSVGLEKAAHLLGLTTVYVESDYWPRETGKRGPVPGTQRLVVPPNPYLEFGDLEAAEAARLFAAHDYAGAARAFDELSRRLSAPAAGAAPAAETAPLVERYAASARLARAYAAWDAFDLAAARDALAAYRNAAPASGRRADLLREQADALTTLAAVAGRAAGKGHEALRTLADPAAVLPLLGSLYANARRREAQGRYDTAALLRYRCLELIAQHRLATWGVLTERPNLAALLRRRPDLDDDYRAVEEQVGFHPRGLPRPGRNGKVAPIALFGGYMLLAALGDPLVAGLDLAQIRERAAARNTSILAHGYRLITRAEYQPFAAVVDELLDRLFRVLGRDRAAWQAAATFLALE